jgi:hypothetical protein
MSAGGWTLFNATVSGSCKPSKSTLLRSIVRLSIIVLSQCKFRKNKGSGIFSLFMKWKLKNYALHVKMYRESFLARSFLRLSPYCCTPFDQRIYAPREKEKRQA